MMKKVTALLLVMLMVFALAACGAAPADPAQAPSAQPAAEAPAAEAAEPSLASPIDTLTVGTTASIETAVFGEYNFDMLASGVSELPLVYQDTKGEYHPLLAAYPFINSTGRGYIDENGVGYDVYTFIRNEPLKPGEMTEWNVWNYIGIADEATSANIQKAVDKGAILVSEDGTMTVNVLVQADAIQAEGFADAKAAFAAFDAQA